MLSWLSLLITPDVPAASSAQGQLVYVLEAVPGKTPETGDSRALRVVNPTLNATISSVKSAEINATRLAYGSANVNLDVAGGFEFELTAGEYDPFIASTLCSTWARFGGTGVGTAGSISVTSGQITFAASPTGTSALSNLVPGSWFKLSPPSGASAGVRSYCERRWLKVGSTTTTTITLDASTPLSGVGLTLSGPGFAVRQSTVANGSASDSYSFEWAQRDVRGYLQYTGMRADTLEIKVESGSLVSGSFGFIGMGHNITGSSVMPGAVQPTTYGEPMNPGVGTSLVIENGSDLLATGSFIKSLRLNVSNNLRSQKAIGVFGSAGVGAGELAVSGTVEMYLSDATYYRKWLAGSYTTLAFDAVDQAGNGYLFELDKVKFRDGSLTIGRDADVMLSLPFDAVYSQQTGRGVRVTAV